MLEVIRLVEVWNPAAAQHLQQCWEQHQRSILSQEQRRALSDEERYRTARELIEQDEQLRQSWRNLWIK